MFISVYFRQLFIYPLKVLSYSIAFGCILISSASASSVAQGSELSMVNIPGRDAQSLNGLWQIVIDPFDKGKRRVECVV